MLLGVLESSLNFLCECYYVAPNKICSIITWLPIFIFEKADRYETNEDVQLASFSFFFFLE